MTAMVWIFTFAVLIVVLVGGAVLPRRAAQPPAGFPWFWIAFPAAILLVAGSISVWLPGVGAVGGWTMYMPLADRSHEMQFLSNEQFNSVYLCMRLYSAALWALPITAVVAAGLSVWAWRRDRV
ncbi:hypothetical protein [Dietzia alimentaria]|uniref:hypothetical protein n=1 Tax=Dietzia alimentaria TaxID=665550 RepID=UPI000299DD40|nr:hypothetical protein [Dietzia alimentaria]